MAYIPYSSRRCLLATGLILLLLLLAACGTNSVTTTGASGPGTPSPVSGTGATPTRSIKNTPVTQPVQNCGTVHSTNLLVVPTDQDLAKGAEDCFWQAYQQCRPATLTYSLTSVDTAAIHTFSLENQNGGCVITDARQNMVAPHAPRPAGSSVCTGLTQQPDGLHFLACGNEGNVLVPAR
ncbi:MAG TPA: hypothetical protein VH593_21165 [Ktedonobacteraceae bacterium]